MRAKKVPSQEKRCQEKRHDGKQCRAARLKGFEYCLFHHPWTQQHREKFEEVDELPLRESSDIHELLVGAVRAVEAGKMKSQQAYALGWLVRLLRENLTGVGEDLALYKKEGLVGTREPEFGEESEGGREEGPEGEAEAETDEKEAGQSVEE